MLNTINEQTEEKALHLFDSVYDSVSNSKGIVYDIKASCIIIKTPNGRILADRDNVELINNNNI